MRRACLLAAGCVSLAMPGLAPGDALPDADNTPLIASLGLPGSDRDAWLAGPGELRWRVSVGTASHSVQDESDTEVLLFDGESTRIGAALAVGVTERLELGIELPYLLHESGSLDSFIDDWHDWFGLPDGIRAQVPNDELRLQYRDNGIQRLDVRDNRRAPGDLRLTAGWQLARDRTRATALLLAVKLPTGDSDALTGSGGTDLSLGIAGDRRSLFGRARWQGFYRANATLIGTPDRLADRARDVVVQLAGGLGFVVNDRLTLLAQARVRSAPYDSAMRILGEPSVLLTVGGTVSLGERLQLAIAVGEDVRVESAPDVTLRLSLRYRPARH
ncbi:MAG: DUF3187 family protein [Woeseiaceae bacterium]|nr:DUF3187 family protein [Woeseiaceae bacterium]